MNNQPLPRTATECAAEMRNPERVERMQSAMRAIKADDNCLQYAYPDHAKFYRAWMRDAMNEFERLAEEATADL